MKNKTQKTKGKAQNFLVIAFLALLFSCDIDNNGFEKNQLGVSPSDRLEFSTLEEFKDLISSVDPQNLSQTNQSWIEKRNNFPNFSPLSEVKESGVNLAGGNHRAFSEEAGTLLDSISELVPDMSLRLFLNQNMEIEIEEIVYKITSFGTFYTHKSNYENLEKVISEFDKVSNKNLRVTQESSTPVELGEDVYFLDTYGDEFDIQSTTTPVIDNKIYQANDYVSVAPYSYALPTNNYEQFTTYNYGAETVVGKIIEGIAGGNTAFEQNYTSKFRLRVKLYDFNYGFYRSVGLNAKLQKKGWTGIWALQSEVKAEKMVLGWDGLLLNLKIPYVMPAGYTSFPSKGVSQEILNFTNFSLPTGNITDVTIPFLGTQSISYNNLEKMLKKTLKVSYATLTKELWKEAESSLSSASYEIKQEDVKSFRKVFPDEVKLALTRHEISGTNINELSFVIDRYYGITFKSSGTGNYTSFSKNVMEPTLSNVKKVYDIDAASVYGATVFLGELKGIRIIKELND